jgi:hypothetical protein
MNPDFSDEKLIRDYLLGRLKEPQQDEIENRIQADPALEELVSVVEDEFIDEYLDAPQTHPDRHDIETHFLRPPQRRSKLDFERALRQRLRPSPPPPGSLPSPPFHHLMSVSAGAAWLMLLIVALGSGLYITRLRQDLRSATAKNQEIETKLKAELELKKEEAAGLRKQVEALETPTQAQPGHPETLMAKLDLRSIDRGDAKVPRVRLAATTQWIEAQVGLEGTPPATSCTISVNSASGQKIGSQTDLEPCTLGD